MVDKLEAENTTLKQYIANKICPTCDWKALLEAQEKENATLREDGDRLEYLFWPSGSTKARYWVRKLMASRDYDDPSPILKIWRDAIDAARKEAKP